MQTDYSGPFQNALAFLAQSLQQRQMMERQGLMDSRQARIDEQTNRQNALDERLTLAKLAEMQQAQAMEGQRRQAFSREFSASPVGPYAGDYATAENPRMPSLANVQHALFGMGDYEGGFDVQGRMPKPEKPEYREHAGVLGMLAGGQFTPVPGAPVKGPEYDIREDETGNLVYIPKTPGLGQAIPSGVTAPAKKPAVQVNVGGEQEKEFEKAYGKQQAERYGSIQTEAQRATTNDGKYDRLAFLLGKSDTSKVRPATKLIAEVAAGLGLNIDPNLQYAQASEMIANQMALELRNPAGGAGMPGAMSDKDREFLVKMIPSLQNDPNSIPIMIDYLKKVSKRSREVARLAREYKNKNKGRFDEGFDDYLAQWSEKNPLFPQQSSDLSKTNGIKFLGFE